MRHAIREDDLSTTVALVGPELEENLGLRYLASSLAAAGIDTVIEPFDASHQLPGVLSRVLDMSPAPDVVALCLAFQWRALDFLALSTALRERGYRGHLTVGGHFATFAANEILKAFPEIDSVCRYEAEETLVALVRQVGAGGSLLEVDGLALRRPNQEVHLTPTRMAPNLATLPWPDRRGKPSTCVGHAIAAIVGSRGCYAHCAFCCISAFHQAAHAGARFRLRPVEDIADEMAWLSHACGREIFIFHDDNFFIPGAKASLERIHALADALDARAMGPYAIVVKARPTDVTREVFTALRDRLHCIRVFLGIETDAVQGLRTLDRGVTPRRNHEAMAILRELGLYVCYNLLLFDPDTDRDSLETNLRFMEQNGDCPSNFGRVELYAGTPLLARMQTEGRATGDWLGSDYRLATAAMNTTFRLALHSFYPRNFAEGALANRLQGTRFEVEVAKVFHANRFDNVWLDEAKRLSKDLAGDSAAQLREISQRVADGATQVGDVSDLCTKLRDKERQIAAAATALEQTVRNANGPHAHIEASIPTNQELPG